MTAAATLGSGLEQRLVAICDRYQLDERARVALEQLLQKLAIDPHAPTSARDPATALDVHVADSLSALELESVRNARTLADLGAGAGFPGLALAAALPEARVHLIESVRRKARFIAAAAQAAKLDNADAVASRAEDWAAGLGANDVVTARALAPLAVLCEYAAPLLVRDGTLVAWKGVRSATEEARAAAAAAELGLEPVAVRPVRPYDGAKDHHLHVYLKVRDTPDRFPRRAGIARKRPLGG
jgi:16S rRNA (guanine527-N7)-methyltransferase